MKVEVNDNGLVRVHHENMVIIGTRWRRLSGRMTFRGLDSHESLQHWEKPKGRLVVLTMLLYSPTSDASKVK